MADMVTMPKLGFDMQEGTLVRWVKGEGDNVQKGEVLAEIETDKATVEVESTFEGVLFKHLVEAGTVVPVGTPIAVVAAPGEEPDYSDFEQVDVEEGETGETKEGPERDLPTQPEPKDVEREQPTAEPAEVQQPEPEQAEEEAGGDEDGRIKVSPVARRIAEERGIDLQRVKGTGPGGRIVRKDIEAAAQSPQVTQQPSAAPVRPEQPAPAAPRRPEVPIPMPAWQAGQIQVPEDQRVDLSKLRAIIGKRMVESRQTVPHFYVTSEYKVEKLMQLRKDLNEVLSEEQKLSVNDFIIKAVAYGLRAFPNLNASLEENAIVRHGHVNIGIAVAVETGLLTVVCKDADMKPMRLISQEVREMVARARSGKVRPEDIEGSTFSISNLGMFDVDQFVAIINPPEAAILAIGSVLETPVVENGEVKVGQRMKLTLSADHRVTDGAEAAKFMQVLGQYLEEPLRLVA